jgi:hypothetical protein
MPRPRSLHEYRFIHFTFFFSHHIKLALLRHILSETDLLQTKWKDIFKKEKKNVTSTPPHHLPYKPSAYAIKITLYDIINIFKMLKPINYPIIMTLRMQLVQRITIYTKVYDVPQKNSQFLWWLKEDKMSSRVACMAELK